MSANSFGSRATLKTGGRSYEIYRLDALERRGLPIARLPYSLKILLENLLRREDGKVVQAGAIEKLARWEPMKLPDEEIAFMPARVLLQDFTGVPAVVDLAAMRDAMVTMGGDPKRVNPLLPAELVIDHSVIVDEFGTPGAFQVNADLEFQRNRERYALLRWAQKAFTGFKVVPPDTGIVHQVNLEYLARVVFTNESQAYPDTLVGTDSHTTMVNGLGVVGWGVGGIEAEAAMLGQPVSMLIPQVIGFRLSGRLTEGATATDLVLTITQLLRAKGVVGKFVEFYGPGVSTLPLADRATIGNMAPEYGATIGIFPVDQETLRYLQFTGRPAEHVQLVEAYMKEQGLFHTPDAPDPTYTDTLELNLATVEPSMAGPRRPQDRVGLREVPRKFAEALPSLMKPTTPPAVVAAVSAGAAPVGRWEGEGGQAGLAPPRPSHANIRIDDIEHVLTHGSVVIAAITSCTNTSNPSVMMAAGLMAKKAVELGLNTKPWVKTSLAPGSKVVTEYLEQAGLMRPLEKLRFHLVGYGCTTCIGNSGPLPEAVSNAIAECELVVCSVLSGNRNFEGRIQQEVRANYLASPPLVVAYALAGRIDIDFHNEPLGIGTDGPVFLREIWPSAKEVADVIGKSIQSSMFRKSYAQVFDGDERWRGLPVPEGDRFVWEPNSTYIRRAPYFDGMPDEPGPVQDIRGARALCLLSDSITTDHISPAGSIRKTSPAGQYLVQHGVQPPDFNSYGARRGNHEVMVRGTFANVRLKNLLAPGTEGPFTVHLPTAEAMTIYDASLKYAAEGVPLIVLAGKEYGSGSSRDWAAKGPRLLGIRAVIAESFERIHRSNLVGMGILPLQFAPGKNAGTLGLTGKERFDIPGLAAMPKELTVTATSDEGKVTEFEVLVRIDTPQELHYYQHGGILEYVLRQIAR
ncbi:MAG: aconitate hydratase AcnA [Gemmatimonadetes bacterium]|nr:MAG: aconitate hydratase AcnA [Gemmatimonadota bacterium]